VTVYHVWKYILQTFMLTFPCDWLVTYKVFGFSSITRILLCAASLVGMSMARVKINGEHK